MVVRERITGAGCALSLLSEGAGTPVVMVHGMRDHAMALSPLAAAFSDYEVLRPDLRGHGESEHPGSYGLLEFVADLKAVMDRLSAPAHLVGHSLGGHVTSRFAALYPDAVLSLTLLDGMGPPRPPEAGSRERDIERMRGQVEMLAHLRAHGRVMPDADDALARLKANNPRLNDDHARLIIAHGLRQVEGGVTWNWDPRVQKIWGTTGDSEAHYGLVRCPVLIVTGDEADIYWRGQGLAEAPASVYQAENERRLTLFADARHVEINGAGHMLHYDAPAAVAQTVRNFIAG